MNGNGKKSERERRDWIIILIILLFGFLCVILAGERAVRFSPVWRLDTSMQSNLDPDSDFLTNRPVSYYEPLDPSILTQPVWVNVFLTPGASFETRTPLMPTNTPLGTNTPIPTLTASPTATKPATATSTLPVVYIPPTNTPVYYPPSTGTPNPPPTSLPPTTVPPATAAPVDLIITKDDAVTTVNPGAAVTYTVRVTNGGPNNVTGAFLSDPAVTGLVKTSVVCSPSPGQCVMPPTVAELESGIFGLPSISNGQFYEIIVSANVTAANGIVTNTAIVAVPAGYTDTVPGNNSALDMNIVNMVADLQITKTDNATHYVANALRLYVITVSNNGPSNITGARVTDIFSTNTNIVNSSVVWGCIPTAGASCVPAGTGDIDNQLVDLESGSSVTYLITAQVVPGPSGPLVNTGTVTEPLGVTDPVPGNNTAIDTDTLFVSSGTTYGNIGTGYDGNIQMLTAGSPVILTLSPQVQVNGRLGPELIFYEEALGSGIDMDQIQLDVSDGSNWYPILNWGDGNDNPGTNIGIPLPPPNPTTCAGEPDNCSIDASFLADYLGNGIRTGITIDLDALVPAGTYAYIRITVPIGSGNAGIDGIYVVP